jgi:hypothetical protein
LGNHNWRGAVVSLGEGIARIKNYQPIYEEINVTDLVMDSADLLTILHQLGAENVADLVEQLEGAYTANNPSHYQWPKIHLANREGEGTY